jgi:soluble lytic murein transglycosylase-like protein
MNSVYRAIGFFTSLSFFALLAFAVNAFGNSYPVLEKKAYVTVSIDLGLPKDNEPTYREEVEFFSDQLEAAYGINEVRATKFADWILQSSAYADVPAITLAGLIMTESSFRYSPVSSVGAIGPGQVRPEIWNGFCQTDLNDPRENVICAGLILRHYYEDFCADDWSCALKTYNVGPTGLRKSAAMRQAAARYLKKIENHVSWIDTSYQINP